MGQLVPKRIKNKELTTAAFVLLFQMFTEQKNTEAEKQNFHLSQKWKHVILMLRIEQKI